MLLTAPGAIREKKLVSRPGSEVWTSSEKFLFRVLFVFVILLVIPYESNFYVRLFNSRSFFWYLSSLAGYRPNFYTLQTESGRWGLGSYLNWAIAGGIALAVALLWTLIAQKTERKRTNYNVLYYWTRVVMRYRIAVGLIAFGFLKVYPMQMPFPSLSNLLTDLGEYNTYKIYWQHVGIAIWYEILLGWVEVIGGILMFFRATTFIGALINAGVLFNIAHANFAYDGGVHVYSSFFVLFSVILLIPYVIDLYRLFVQQRDVVPRRYVPAFNTPRKRGLYFAAKASVVILFTVVYGILRYDVHYNEKYLKEPVNPGLSNAAGLYNVSEFRLNGNTLPYNPLDSVRWQNVVFETWGTMIYKVNKAFPVSLNNGTPNLQNVQRSYELAGIAGGRRFLYYEADTSKQVLYLKDKSQKRGGDEEAARGTAPVKKQAPEKPLFTWRYERPDAGRIILHGRLDNKDSIDVILDRVDRKFAIQTSRIQY
ncbi:MAG: hypothetical protein EOO04_07355 [Chitinophagaceae bacterium]|nr:MAG: hypothetical protein EOO04_07355 [Chitinophagaceae bacterium]